MVPNDRKALDKFGRTGKDNFEKQFMHRPEQYVFIRLMTEISV